MNKNEILDKITEQLNFFKFNRNSLGYEYLIEAIYMVIMNKSVIKDFQIAVYPVIASKYNTKGKNVQWCISKLISLMFVNTEKEIIKDYFNLYYDDRLFAKAFIIEVSKKIN